MELKDLVGLKKLTAVDFGELEPEADDSWGQKSQTMTFVLDGVAYTVIEDPSDGYRSSMKDIKVSADYAPKNVFEPIQVMCIHVADGGSSYAHSSDLLRLLDTQTGATLLEAGTDNDDDYYPSFVANWSPLKLKEAA